MLNWKKCHFIVQDGIVMGHGISKKGIVIGHHVSEKGINEDKAKMDIIEKLQPLRQSREYDVSFATKVSINDLSRIFLKFQNI